MTENRQALQRAINAQILMPARAWQSTCPVVAADPPYVRLIGTATLFQVADVRFVVTAGHVAEAAANYNKTIGIGPSSGESFVALDGEWVRSTETKFDIALCRLTAERAAKIAHQKFLGLRDVVFRDLGLRAVYALFGFPGVWAEVTGSDSLPLRVKGLEFATYAYDGAPLTDYDPTIHIAMSCTTEHLTTPDGAPLLFQDRDGQEIRLPKGLSGVSGCSVWHIGDLDVPLSRWAELEPRVAGIQNRSYQSSGALRATKWIAVTTLINEAFPDLRPVLNLTLGPDF